LRYSAPDPGATDAQIPVEQLPRSVVASTIFLATQRRWLECIRTRELHGDRERTRSPPVPVIPKPCPPRTRSFQTHTRQYYPWYSAHPHPSPQTQIANTLLRGCKKVVNAQNSAIITHKLYSLQSMRKQQSVDRFCRQHISSIFKCMPRRGK